MPCIKAPRGSTKPPPMLTPDGARYLAMAEVRVARPFHLRWLQTRLCGKNLRRWTWLTRASVLAVGGLVALYAGNPWMAAIVFLPGITFSWKHPVLVDPLGMALALGSALLMPISPLAGIAVACLAGMTRETAPIWAAIYAWNPLCLIGLIPVALRALVGQGVDVLDEQNAWILEHPFKASQLFHQGQWLNPSLMVAPWGGLLAGLATLDAQLGVALAAGYAQLIIATDSVRLYQWAAPVMALACVRVVPLWALPFVALSILFNPFKGQGI